LGLPIVSNLSRLRSLALKLSFSRLPQPGQTLALGQGLHFRQLLSSRPIQLARQLPPSHLRALRRRVLRRRLICLFRRLRRTSRAVSLAPWCLSSRQLQRIS